MKVFDLYRFFKIFLKEFVLFKFIISIGQNTEQKQLRKRRAFVTYRLWSITEGNEGRNIEVGTDAETMEKCCSLAQFP